MKIKRIAPNLYFIKVLPNPVKEEIFYNNKKLFCLQIIHLKKHKIVVFLKCLQYFHVIFAEMKGWKENNNS